MNSALIEKIKKLLALSQSDNPNEAANAAALAQRLIAQHQVSATELGGESQESARVEIDPLYSMQRLQGWLRALSAGICRLNGVYSYNSYKRGNQARCMLIGRPSDVENVRYLFAYMRSEVERLAQKHARGQGRTYADSYRMGVVLGALDAMKRVTAEVQAQKPGLVRVDSRIEESRALAPEGLRKGTPLGSGNAEAFERGKTAGGHMHGSTQIGGNRTRLLNS